MDLDQKIPRSRTKKITTFNNSTWRGNISLQCKLALRKYEINFLYGDNTCISVLRNSVTV